MKKVKFKEFETEYPGREGKVRGVNGFIVEAFTSNSRKNLLDLLDKKMKEGKIKVYGLRHSDTDWSKPVSVEKFVFVNRFGWFVTTDLENSPLYNKRLKKIVDGIYINRKSWEYTGDEDIDMIQYLNSL